MLFWVSIVNKEIMGIYTILMWVIIILDKLKKIEVECHCS